MFQVSDHRRVVGLDQDRLVAQEGEIRFYRHEHGEHLFPFDMPGKLVRITNASGADGVYLKAPTGVGSVGCDEGLVFPGKELSLIHI